MKKIIKPIQPVKIKKPPVLPKDENKQKQTRKDTQ